MQYDAFQQKAIAAIDLEKSVLVSAPTGAGKTAIAEYAIEKALARNERVTYTAPIKALSNQKYRDFQNRYPDKVGLLTGDVSLNPHAPILIMTTEIYRNQLFENHQRLQSTSWVIFDEVHYLDDAERGTVWEEAIMFSPEHVRLLALSATAPNIQELADWIRSILRHPIEVVIETRRPVPLVHHFQCQGQIFEDTIALKKEGYSGQDLLPGAGRFQRMQHHRGRFHGKHAHSFSRVKPNRIDDLIRYLSGQNRLPCLYFAFGRKRTEELAWEQQPFDFLNADEKRAVTGLYRELCERFDLARESSASELGRLVQKGIAFHHAGMLPTLKEVVEQLFTSKLIKLIFTTETFALGINMPAKTVVFDELRKFYGTGFAFLRTRDYYQMAGRAGRRGMDTQGYVYSRIHPNEIRHSTLMRIIYGKPEPIESQFNSCYATLLNLYSQFGSKLLEIYPRSLHYFQSGKKGRHRGRTLIEKKIALLTRLGHIHNGQVTPKGEFASWMYGYELLLAQMLEQRVLETLDESRLSVLLCSLVFEPRKNQPCENLPGNLAVLEKTMLRFFKGIHEAEAEYKIDPPSRRPYFHLARAVEAWVQGCAFEDMGRYTEADEGELIRHFRMVIQLLRQLERAPQVSAVLKATAGAARKKINRGVVDAEKQLRGM